VSKWANKDYAGAIFNLREAASKTTSRRLLQVIEGRD